MKVREGNEWIEISERVRINGDEHLVVVAGPASFGFWSVAISARGVFIYPDDDSEVFNSTILQFVGEKVTPLILSKQTASKQYNIQCLPQATHILGRDTAVSSVGLNPVKLATPEPGAIYAPFDCEVSKLATFNLDGRELTVINLVSTNKLFVLEIKSLSPARDGLSIGDKIPCASILGTLDGTTALTLYERDLDTNLLVESDLSPIILFRAQGQQLYEQFIRKNHINDIMLQEECDMFLQELTEFEVKLTLTPNDLHYSNESNGDSQGIFDRPKDVQIPGRVIHIHPEVVFKAPVEAANEGDNKDIAKPTAQTIDLSQCVAEVPTTEADLKDPFE